MKPELQPYLEYPGPNAPTELQLLARLCIKWVQMGLLSYENINEVYDEVAQKLQEASE